MRMSQSAAAGLPRITVVTPSFNQASYLDETIRAVLAQRDEIHEYFVVDGGSTDGSVDIIKRYADGLDFWVSEKDQGQADAIHKGFSRATGDVLFWVNSDDVLAPGAVARARQAFAAHPEWDVLTGYSVFLDDKSQITKVNCVPGESRWWAARGVLHVTQQTCYFTRALYEKVGGIDTSLHCALDTELWLRFFEANAIWGHVPAILGGFRLHGEMKGMTWTDIYEKERPIVAARHHWYPTKLPPLSLGRLMYRAQRLGGMLTGKEKWSRPLIGSQLSSADSAALSGSAAA